jgi:hypothetical protein
MLLLLSPLGLPFPLSGGGGSGISIGTPRRLWFSIDIDAPVYEVGRERSARACLTRRAVWGVFRMGEGVLAGYRRREVNIWPESADITVQNPG